MSRNRFTSPAHSPDGRKISVIIPAAGIGSRMKSYGPKSLIKIKDNLSIIDNQLKYIYKYLNNPQIILVTGFGASKINSHLKGTRIERVYNKNWENSNVGESIKIGLESVVHKDVLIIYGDLVFNAWTLKVPFGMYSMLLIDEYGLMKKEEVGCLVNKSEIVNIMYDLPDKWAQIGYFTGKELEIMKRQIKENDYTKSFGFEMINNVIDEGGKFIAHSPQRMRVCDIDSSKDLNLVTEIL